MLKVLVVIEKTDGGFIEEDGSSVALVEERESSFRRGWWYFITKRLVLEVFRVVAGMMVGRCQRLEEREEVD